jgi:hypothetical protein
VPPDRATEFNFYLGKLGWDGQLEASMGRRAAKS